MNRAEDRSASGTVCFFSDTHRFPSGKGPFTRFLRRQLARAGGRLIRAEVHRLVRENKEIDLPESLP